MTPQIKDLKRPGGFIGSLKVEDGDALAWCTFAYTKQDLELSDEEFAARYLTPAFLQALRELEYVKETRGIQPATPLEQLGN